MAVPAAMLLKIGLKAGAKKFGEKLGEALFKEIFKGVFGSTSGVTAAQMRKIFTEVLDVFADELKLHIDHAFAKQRVNDAQLSLLNLVAAMEAFRAAPEAQDDNLDEAAEQARNVLNTFLQIGTPAIEHYVFAVTLYIAVQEARAEYIHPDNRRVITHVILPAAHAEYRAMRREIVAAARSRVRVTHRSHWGPPAGETITTAYTVLVDGQPFTGSQVVHPPNGMPQGQDAYDRMMERKEAEIDRLVQEALGRLSGTDAMLKAWGEKYEIDAERLSLLDAGGAE